VDVHRQTAHSDDPDQQSDTAPTASRADSDIAYGRCAPQANVRCGSHAAKNAVIKAVNAGSKLTVLLGEFGTVSFHAASTAVVGGLLEVGKHAVPGGVVGIPFPPGGICSGLRVPRWYWARRAVTHRPSG